MKKLILLAFLLVVGLASTRTASAQARVQSVHYVLRVESTDPATPHVHFLAAYSFHNSETPDKLTLVAKDTPLRMEFSADRFIGLFQDTSRDGGITVSLKRYNQARSTGDVVSETSVNILYVNEDQSGAGWPAPPPPAHKSR
ncbi:MAG TPA: hypothetical protein PL001_08870 [Candidatus Kryptobacter bacterium]|nr:hypothetical protein [Candidatus Kryptobacter bacterium]